MSFIVEAQKLENSPASTLKSNVYGILALIFLNPVSNFCGVYCSKAS